MRTRFRLLGVLFVAVLWAGLASAQTVECAGACEVTVSHVITWPDFFSGITPEKVADYMALFWAFVLVGVTVWGLKALLGLFTGDYEK